MFRNDHWNQVMFRSDHTNYAKFINNWIHDTKSAVEQVWGEGTID